MDTGKHLRAWLAFRKIKPGKFAPLIGTTPNYLSQILGGKKPSLDLAVAIERATDGGVPASSWIPETGESQ